jgi:hypothetical protein
MSELRLERELRKLVPALAGDWRDVTARAEAVSTSRFRRRTVVLAFAAAALLIAAGSALAIGHVRFGWFTTSPAPTKVPTVREATAYITGQSLWRPGREPLRLNAPLLAPFLGHDARLAIASRDGRVGYHSADGRTPELRVIDLPTGKERLLARNAHTLAWSADGSVAYVQTRGGAARESWSRVGHVIVGRPGVEPRPWTTAPGPFEVVAWARDRLLVNIRPCLVPDCPRDLVPGVYILGESGRLTSVPLASVTALSPDGRLAFGRHDPVAGQDSPSPLVRVVELDTNEVITTLDLTAAARDAGLGGRVPGSLQRGSWRGDTIVASFSGGDSALVFFEFGEAGLEVREVVRVRADVLPGSEIIAFGTPVFTGRSLSEILVPIRGVSDDRAVAAVLVCARDKRHCTRGKPLAVREWFSVVENPSRP